MREPFFGIHMALRHEPPGFVGAQIKNGQVNVVRIANLVESVKISRVAGYINGVSVLVRMRYEPQRDVFGPSKGFLIVQ